MRFQLSLALRYLKGRKLRTFLTTLSIVFGVMLIFGLNGMLPAIRDSFRQNLMGAAGQVDLTLTSETNGVFSAGVADTVRETSGVAHVMSSLSRPISLPPGYVPETASGLPITSFLVQGVAEDTVAVRPLIITDGRNLAADEGNVVLISKNLAETMSLAVGDTLTLPSAMGTTDLEVVGLVAAPPSAGAETIYVPLSVAQTMFNLPGQINRIDVLFAPGSDGEAVRQAVMANVDPGFKAGASETGLEIMAALEMGEFVYTMFGVLALAMGGFIIFNTFRTAALERRRDIGMLRAIGASRRTIMGAIMMESLLQGVVGTAVGLAAGYLVALGMLAAIEPMWQSLMNTTLGKPSFAPGIWALTIGLGVGVTILAGWFPARAASRMSPLEALRPSSVAVERRAAGKKAIIGVVFIAAAFFTLVTGQIGLASLGIILFMIGLTLVTPALVYPIARFFGGMLTWIFAREGRIAQGNMTRQPGRAAVTVSAMTIGLAILVALAGLIASMNTGIIDWVNKSLGADYLIMPQSLVLGGGNVGASPEMARRIRDIDGVAGVTTLRHASSRAGEADLQVIGLDPATYPALGGLVFNEGEETAAYAALAEGRNLIVNGIFAAQNGVEIGQTLTLQTAEGPRPYQVVGIGTDFMNMKLATGYISQENLARDFHETTDLLVLVNQEEGADTAVVEAAIRDIVEEYPAFTLFTAVSWQETLQTDILSKLNMVYVLLLVVAFPSLLALVNTLTINVLERTREIGVMRAVGATRRQVRRMILAESLLLAATGIAFGILAGLWLGYIMVGGMDLIGLNFPYFFPWQGILFTIAVGLLFAVIGALLPARQAAHLDIVDALAYE